MWSGKAGPADPVLCLPCVTSTYCFVFISSSACLSGVALSVIPSVSESLQAVESGAHSTVSLESQNPNLDERGEVKPLSFQCTYAYE